MSKIIIFIADDWGLSRQIHDSISLLHQEKAIDAAAIMMGQAHTGEAVAYAKDHPDLRVGLHLFATDRDCRPCTMKQWPPFWPEDIFINTALSLPKVRGIVLAEVRAQLLAYRETGLPLHFLNSHFHFHAHHQLLDAVSNVLWEVFPDFKGWLRLGASRLFPANLPGPVLSARDWMADLIGSGIFAKTWAGRHNDTLWGLDATFQNDASQIAAAVASLEDGFHEFFFHPGRGKKLTDVSTDQAALLQLTTLVPQSRRHITGLPVL